MDEEKRDLTMQDATGSSLEEIPEDEVNAVGEDAGQPLAPEADRQEAGDTAADQKQVPETAGYQEQVQEKQPANDAEAASEINAANDAGESPETAPEADPEKISGETPEADPEKVSGEAPEEAPAQTSEETPEKSVDTDQAKPAEEAVETAPEKQPEISAEKKPARSGRGKTILLLLASAAAVLFLALYGMELSRNRSLQAEYDEISKALASATGSNEELSGKNTDLASEVEEMAASVEALEAEKEDLIRSSKADKAKINTLESEKQELQAQVDSQNEELEELKNGADATLVKIKNAYEEKDWDTVISLAGELHSKYNGSDADKEGQTLAEQAQAELDAAAAKAAEEEAKGYETGITYDQLARTPDDYIGKKVKFSGKVVQVLEGDDTVDIRLAVNSDHNTILYGVYDKKITSSRVLEDDIITVYGTSLGTISYKSTFGGTITIPGIVVSKIEM